MALGHIVSHIRNRGSYASLRPDLDQMGFPWIVWNDREFRSVIDGYAMAILRNK